MTTLSCSLKAQLWKRVRRKGPCHHPKKLENHGAGHLMRKKSKPWTASPKHWFPAGALSYLAGTKLLLQCGPNFLYRWKTAGIPDLCAWRQGLSQTPKPHPPRRPTSFFFSSQCLSSLPPMPTILAWVSQLSPRCGLFEKTYGILV